MHRRRHARQVPAAAGPDRHGAHRAGRRLVHHPTKLNQCRGRHTPLVLSLTRRLGRSRAGGAEEPGLLPGPGRRPLLPTPPAAQLCLRQRHCACGCGQRGGRGVLQPARVGGRCDPRGRGTGHGDNSGLEGGRVECTGVRRGRSALLAHSTTVIRAIEGHRTREKQLQYKHFFFTLLCTLFQQSLIIPRCTYRGLLLPLTQRRRRHSAS